MPLRRLSELRNVLGMTYALTHTAAEQKAFNEEMYTQDTLHDILRFALVKKGMTFNQLRNVDLGLYGFLQHHDLRNALYEWAAARRDVKLPAKRTIWSKKSTIAAAFKAGFNFIPFISRTHGHTLNKRVRDRRNGVVAPKKRAKKQRAKKQAKKKPQSQPQPTPPAIAMPDSFRVWPETTLEPLSTMQMSLAFPPGLDNEPTGPKYPPGLIIPAYLLS